MKPVLYCTLGLLLALAPQLYGQQAAYRLLLTDDSLNQALGRSLDRDRLLESGSAAILDSLQRCLGALDSLRRLRERLVCQPDTGLFDSAPSRALRAGDVLEERLLGSIRNLNAPLAGIGDLLDGLERSVQARRQLAAWLLTAPLPVASGGRLLGLELLRAEQLRELSDAWELLEGLRPVQGKYRDPALWGGQP